MWHRSMPWPTGRQRGGARLREPPACDPKEGREVKNVGCSRPTVGGRPRGCRPVEGSEGQGKDGCQVHANKCTIGPEKWLRPMGQGGRQGAAKGGQKKMPDAAATRQRRRRRQGTAQAENGANRPQRLRCTAPGTQSPCSGSPRRSLSAGASEIARGPVCRVAPRWRHGPGAQGPHAANALAPRHGQGENGANRPQRLRCTAQGPHAANGRPRMGQGRPRDRVQRGTARHSRRRLREGPSE